MTPYKKNTYLYSCGLDDPKCIEVIKNLYFNYTHKVINTNSSYCPRYISHNDNIYRLKKELDSEGIQYQSNFKIDDVQYDIRLLHSNIMIAIQSSSQQPSLEYIRCQSDFASKNMMICHHLYDWNNYSQFAKSLQSRYMIKQSQYAISQISQIESETFTRKFNTTNMNLKYSINLAAVRTDTPKHDIVMMISFGLSEDSSYEWVLSQMATKPHYIVEEGYQRIFQQFISKYDPRSIRCILDKSKSSGSMIKCLGFQKISEYDSQVIWSQYKSAISSRMVHNVIDIADDSLEEMMTQSKYLPVPDCGYDVYEWRRA